MRIPTLSILQPYASAIVSGAKGWENRPWRPPANLIGRVWLIQAGRNSQLLSLPQLMSEVDALWPNMPKDFPRGAVVGFARLTEVRAFDPSLNIWDSWACGPWCWRFEQAQAIEPIPLRGMQRVFYVDPSQFPAHVLHAIRVMEDAPLCSSSPVK